MTDIAPGMVEAVRRGVAERGLGNVDCRVPRGHAPAGDPFGPGGPFSLSDHDRNRALVAEAGFNDVEVTELTGAMPSPLPAPRGRLALEHREIRPVERVAR